MKSGTFRRSCVASEVICLDPDSLGAAGWTLDFPWELLQILTPAPGVGPCGGLGTPGPSREGGGREKNSLKVLLLPLVNLTREKVFPKGVPWSPE